MALVLGAGLAATFLWGAEAILAVLHPDPFRVARARAQAEGRLVDSRPRAEVVAALQQEGVAAVPRVVPASLLVPDPDGRLRSRLTSAAGGELLPLSGLGDRPTVLCAEAGPYAIFESDRHGLRNPPELWTRAPVELALVGDSFTLGECVADGETIADALRARWPSTVNLGYTGHSPLFELAALVEYGPTLRPRTTLWLYFENDLSWFDLERSARSPLLMRYLEPGFSQHLVERREEIDARLEALVERDFAGAEDLRAAEHAVLREPSRLAGLRSQLRLEQLRRVLGRMRPRPRADAVPERFALFQAILARARAVTAQWEGELVVVYLPGVWSFDPFVGLPGWTGPHVRDAVRAEAQRQGLAFVDVSAAFAAHDAPLSLFAYPGQSALVGAPHMNAAGYAYSASVLEKALVARSPDADSTRRSQISRQ
jgi:hypothetical protein